MDGMRIDAIQYTVTSLAPPFPLKVAVIDTVPSLLVLVCLSFRKVAVREICDGPMAMH